MKGNIFLLFLLCTSIIGFSQDNKDTTSIKKESENVFKKRVLECAEVDILTSFYTQDGDNASVTGGIGTEKLPNRAERSAS